MELFFFNKELPPTLLGWNHILELKTLLCVELQMLFSPECNMSLITVNIIEEYMALLQQLHTSIQRALSGYLQGWRLFRAET